jgi:hypothetical protein
LREESLESFRIYTIIVYWAVVFRMNNIRRAHGIPLSLMWTFLIPVFRAAAHLTRRGRRTDARDDVVGFWELVSSFGRRTLALSRHVVGFCHYWIAGADSVHVEA